MKRLILPLTLGLSLIAIGGCDGGDGFAGIEGTGAPVAASGTVTGFGSIYVNGLRFDTHDADFIVEGVSGGHEDDLAPGMQVSLRIDPDAPAGAPSALEVRYLPWLRGPVSEVSGQPEALTLTVFGQTLTLPADAAFSGVTPESLRASDWVEISALPGDPALVTRISAAAPEAAEWLSGSVSSVDPVLQRLTIGDQAVDYSPAQLDGDAQALSAGTPVRIRGQSDGDSFVADWVLIGDQSLNAQAGEQVLVEGQATDVDQGPRPDFTLNGRRVSTANAEVDGGNLNMLRASVMRVVVSGTLADDGTLDADNIRIIRPGNQVITGEIDSIDPQAQQLRVMGRTVRVNDFTSFEDSGPQANRQLRLADLNPGERVIVFATNNGQSELVATRIRRLSVQDNRPNSVQGPITRLEDPLVYLEELIVDVGAIDPDLRQSLTLQSVVAVTGERPDGEVLIAQELRVVDRADNPQNYHF
ncbi:DUF5666 domain-containing protein [Marinimicrobium alkaliphilum]|uniref:DUF5666 domain-containing protein n=1 Tax=Marinimicrobium alkaliphilum TaxID=2202654 RepID=UPI000DB95B3F|nr:DUF5666 domain-containing protein [Marinimicrobium alkaliphilum]